MFEGVPGSGKTTITKRVHEYLINKGIRTTFYSEGCDPHPVDLTWHAFLTNDEYENIIDKYNEQANRLHKHSIFEDGYALVQYRNINSFYFDGELLKYLKAHEVCYSNTPVVSMETFTAIFRNRWRQYAGGKNLKGDVTILDGAFFHHQIHDLMRLFAPEKKLIIRHLELLIKEVEELKPVLFYLSSPDIKECLLRASEDETTLERNTMDNFISFAEHSKYGEINNLFGLDGAIQFWGYRQSVEFEAMNELPLKSFVINNTNCDWDSVFHSIVNILNSN